MHETSVRVKVAKCALDAAHLSLPNAHRPLPARSTNWANRWTPTDLFDPALVVAHAELTLSSAFRFPPSTRTSLSFPRTGSINSRIGCRCRMPESPIPTINLPRDTRDRPVYHRYVVD